jgi:methylated-DNA-protein-cysteine methyltransferase related protein
MNKFDIFEQVYDIVRQVPRGKVVTYGDIAAILDINPRYVGYILHHNPYPGEVPCHRVINAEGRVATTFAFGGGDAQQKLLEAEGIIFRNHKIDLTVFRYRL